MTAEQQYIDLYDAGRDIINANSAPVLNAQREAARAALARVGLAKGGKDFTATDPESILADDYALNLARHDVPTERRDLFSCGVPDISTQVYYLINEQCSRPEHRQELPDGVWVGSLRDFATVRPDICAGYYNKLASQDLSLSKDGRGRRESICSLGESALNTMLCQDGFVLYVPDGIRLERPVQLISLLRGVDDVMACQRLLVVVGANASASLLVCEHASDFADSPSRLLSLQVAEIYVGRGASLDFYSLEEHHERVSRLAQVYVRQEADSSTSIGHFALTAGRTRNRVYVELAGERADTQLFGMVTADAAQQVDNLTFIDHAAPHCTSSELYKYVLDDESRGGFIGRILVRDGAVGTDARQTDRNLCLTDRARMLARPELEIYADDVKCSHGATVGQLDQQALYYMRTRGIPEREARMLLMFAFMSDVIDKIRITPLADRLRHLVEKRFRGELGGGCSTCRA